MNSKNSIILGFFILLFLLPGLSLLAQAPTAPDTQVKYEIWVELDAGNRQLNGKENISWRNTTADEVNDIWFHLYWNSFKNDQSAMSLEIWEEEFTGGFRFGRRVKDGEWGWTQVDRIALEDGTDLTSTIQYMTPDLPLRPNDQTVMKVTLPQPLQPGETVNLSLDFTARIPRTQARSGYYLDSYFFGQWYPKPGVYEEGKGWNCHQYHWVGEFYSNFADFTVHITVPKQFVIGSSGKQTARSENTEKGTVTYTQHQERVHDFAWTVKPDYIKLERDFIAHKEVTPEEYAKVAQQLQLPVEQIKLKDVKMILLLNPEHKDQADRQFKALRMAIKYYGLWYGPYPYETMTLVDPPFRNDCGGMEYPTLITGGSHPMIIPTAGMPEGVIIHEFGHNFWYGLVANNEFEEAWLDEGINSYSDNKVQEAAYGESTFPMFIGGIPYNRYMDPFRGLSTFLTRTAGINAVELDPIVTDSWRFSSAASYGLNVYQRAATLLHTLERILGEDSMLRVMRTFQMEYRYKHPKTQDFIDVVNRVSGRDMSWFFRELMFGTNEFDYGVSSIVSKRIDSPTGFFDKNGEKEEITSSEAEDKDDETDEKQYLTLVQIRRYGEAVLGGDAKLKIDIVFEDGTTETKYWDGKKRWVRYRFKKPVKVKYAHVDPETVYLIDKDITNNSLKREAEKAPAVRWSNRFHFWIQNMLQIASIFS